jgi:hypothetical protein
MSIEFREADSSRRWRRKPSHTAFTIEPPNPKCYQEQRGSEAVAWSLSRFNEIMR